MAPGGREMDAARGPRLGPQLGVGAGPAAGTLCVGPGAEPHVKPWSAAAPPALLVPVALSAGEADVVLEMACWVTGGCFVKQLLLSHR